MELRFISHLKVSEIRYYDFVIQLLATTKKYLVVLVIMQKGHNKGADLWSWGVMLYEMIVGMTPFYDGIVDQVS